MTDETFNELWNKEIDQNAKQEMIGVARAAMMAMREPAEAMVSAAEKQDISPGDARRIWTMMIEAALDEASAKNSATTA